MKELKDYIHLYIGCRCTYPDTDPEAPWIVATLTGCTIAYGVETTYLEVQKHAHGETHGDYLAWKSNGNHNSDALNLKLILRPLESMTDDEGDEMWSKMTGSFEIEIPIIGETAEITISPYQVAFLLSKGFDLFGLKEAGLAVYE